MSKAGWMSRLIPTVSGPIFTPTRVLKTGSVRMVNPSTRIRTVLCPIQAARSPWPAHEPIFGIRGDGRTERLRSSASRRQRTGPACTANPASVRAFRATGERILLYLDAKDSSQIQRLERVNDKLKGTPFKFSSLEAFQRALVVPGTGRTAWRLVRHEPPRNIKAKCYGRYERASP